MVQELDPELTIDWEFSWTDETVKGRGRPAASEGVLTLRVGDDVLWSVDDGDWPWIELLEWLTSSWTWIRVEDGLPADLPADVANVGALRYELKRAVRYEPDGVRTQSEMALWDFIETHDLSRALAGANTRPVLIWRQGLLGHLLTEQTHYVTHWRRILSTVESIGDAIAHRLLRAPDDQRSRAARMNWQMRDAVSSGTLLATARGQDATIDALTFPTIWRDSDIGEIEYSPILAAARMTSRLPATVAGRVLRLINALPGRETSIPAVSDAVIAAANLDRSAPPYAQAYEYAKVFRVTLGLDENSPFLPEQWLDHMGVLVQDERLGEKTIDAVAAWGPQNGPAIIINRDGWFSSSPNGRNTSLAHEICHLLIDRQDALPAAEVMGGRVDVAVEQRARAFAAEVMLPRAVAGASLRQAADESGAVRAVRSLSNRFGVSHEIVARQAYNSQVALKPTVFERLRQMVSDPSRFNP